MVSGIAVVAWCKRMRCFAVKTGWGMPSEIEGVEGESAKVLVMKDSVKDGRAVRGGGLSSRMVGKPSRDPKSDDGGPDAG